MPADYGAQGQGVSRNAAPRALWSLRLAAFLLLAGVAAASNSSKCQPGSFLDGNNGCSLCPEGKYRQEPLEVCTECPSGRFAYRLGRIECEACEPGRYSPMPGRPFCNICPRGGVCGGTGSLNTDNGSALFFVAAQEYYLLGDDASVRAAFQVQVSDRSWDPYNETGFDGIGPFMCTPPDSCTGRNECKPGSEGLFCGTCALGYQKISHKDLCGKCPTPFQNFGLCLLALFFLYTGVVFIDRRHLIRMGQPKEVAAVVPKIMASFFVLLSVVGRNIRLLDTLAEIGHKNAGNWTWIFPLYIAVFIGNALESPAKTVFSIKCFGEGIVGTDVRGFSVALAWLFLPILLTMHSVVICLVNLCVTLRRSGCDGLREWRRYAAVVVANIQTIGVVLIYFVHPMIASQFLSVFNCESYDPATLLEYDTPRLVSDMGIDCSSPEHLGLQIAAGLGIVFWAFGIPMLFLLRLYAQEHWADQPVTEPTVWRIYGFLMDGYEPKYYYYEAIFMLRKVIFPIAANLPWISSDSRTVLLLGMSLGFLALHLNQQPFDNRAYCGLDKLETQATFTLIFLMMGRLFQATMESSRHDLPDHAGQVVYVPAIVNFFWVCSNGCYLLLRSHIWPAGRPSPVLPTKISNFLDGRACLTLIPPPMDVVRDMLDVEHLCMGHRKSNRMGNARSTRAFRWTFAGHGDTCSNFEVPLEGEGRTLSERERGMLQILLAEVAEVCLRRHELCLHEAPELIYLPSLVVHIERVIASCMVLALKTRVQQARSWAKAKTLKKMATQQWKEFRSYWADIISGRDHYRCFEEHAGSKWGSADNFREEKEILERPVSLEEVHLALNTLAASLLDPEKNLGSNFLQTFIWDHRGLLEGHSNAWQLFTSVAHLSRMESWRKLGGDAPSHDASVHTHTRGPHRHRGSCGVDTSGESSEMMQGSIVSFGTEEDHDMERQEDAGKAYGEDSSELREVRVVASRNSSRGCDVPVSPSLRLAGEARALSSTPNSSSLTPRIRLPGEADAEEYQGFGFEEARAATPRTPSEPIQEPSSIPRSPCEVSDSQVSKEMMPQADMGHERCQEKRAEAEEMLRAAKEERESARQERTLAEAALHQAEAERLLAMEALREARELATRQQAGIPPSSPMAPAAVTPPQKAVASR